MHNLEAALANSTQSGEPPSSRPTNRARFALPSLSDLIFMALLLGLCGPLAQRLLGDGGIGWHIRTGEIILKTRSVPRVDLFSVTMQGKPWYAWEWLYDTGAGAVHQVAGLNGVVLVNAVAVSLTFALLLDLMLARAAGLVVAISLVVLGIFASSIHLLARPHVVSWLLTVVWFGVLEKFERDGNVRVLLWLPVSMLLWVNLHGGFVVGLILLGIFLASACAVGLRKHRKSDPANRRARALAAVGVVSALATLANPYGYALHIHIYQYLTDRFLMSHIDEFKAPNFHGLAPRCFAAIVLLTLAGIRSAWRRTRASEWLIVALAVYSGLRSARNVPWSSMLLVLIAAPYLAEMLRGWSQGGAGARGLFSQWAELSSRMSVLDRSLRGHAWAAAAVAGVVWAALHGGYLGPTKLMDAQFDAKRFPVGAVAFLARSGVRDPVFTPDQWGGYLIYRLYPRVLVVVDDRHDLYGAEFFRNYLQVIHAEPGWEKALAEMHPDWVLLPVKSALVDELAPTPAWKLAYRDEMSVLYRRARTGEAVVVRTSKTGTSRGQFLRKWRQTSPRSRCLRTEPSRSLRVDVKTEVDGDFYGVASAQGGSELPGGEGSEDAGGADSRGGFDDLEAVQRAGAVEDAGDGNGGVNDSSGKLDAHRLRCGQRF